MPLRNIYLSYTQLFFYPEWDAISSLGPFTSAAFIYVLERRWRIAQRVHIYLSGHGTQLNVWLV